MECILFLIIFAAPLKIIDMKSYTIIKSDFTQYYYIYSMCGRLIDRVASLADVSSFIHKTQSVYQLRHATFSDTCCDSVVIVTLK